MLRDVLQRILAEYSQAREEPLTKHPLAIYIRTAAEDEVTAALGGLAVGLKVQGSPGAGNWAVVPWISVFDLTVTDSAQRGYYVVYLFHSSEPTVHLSLNQGTTAVREEYRRAAHDVLRERAGLIRRRIPEFAARLPENKIELGSRLTLPGDYEAGHALGITYRGDKMPTEEKLRDDLQQIVRAYRALTFRGGFDAVMESDETLIDASELHGTTLLERRQYRLHRRIERNSSAAKLARNTHGTQCQCCGFDFGVAYGAIGEGYIEAHHLKPLSTLIEGQIVRYDLATDFAVLCANCHRMIHRQRDPSDLDGLRAQLRCSKVRSPAN